MIFLLVVCSIIAILLFKFILRAIAFVAIVFAMGFMVYGSDSFAQTYIGDSNAVKIGVAIFLFITVGFFIEFVTKEKTKK